MDRDCKNCVYSNMSEHSNGCTRWSCDFISIDDAVKAYNDIEDGSAVRVVTCDKCQDCTEQGGHANGGGYLYCRQRCRVVTEADYCSWGKERI